MRSHLTDHPGSAGAVFAAAMVFLGHRLGIDLSAEEAAVYVAAVSYLVSYVDRFIKARQAAQSCDE